MSEWTKQPIKELLDGQWSGEWGSEPDHGLPSVVVYRSTDLDDAGHLLEDDGVYRFIPPTKLNAKKLVAGDILIEASGGAPDRPVGRAAQFAGSRGESAIGANFLRTLRPKKTVCTSFLRWALVALQQQSAIWRYQQQTTGMINLKVSDYLNHLIDTPPLPEQRRIAEIISTVDEAIEQTEAMIAKYQQIKAGLMHDLFTRGVTPDGHLRPTREQAPHLYKESPLGRIPKEWEVVSVRGCGSVQLGRQRSPDQMSGRWTMPYLRVANVFDGYIDYNDVLEMDFTPDERRTFSLKQGDILLNEGQSLELVGRCALYDGQDDAFCFQNTLVRFRPFDKQCPFFYRFLFKWFLDCGLFTRIAKQTTSVAHLGADRFARMRCISVPYDEQLRIAERLGVLQARLDSDMAHASKLRQQKHGLMHDLLTGRVHVKVAEAASP